MKATGMDSEDPKEETMKLEWALLFSFLLVCFFLDGLGLLSPSPGGTQHYFEDQKNENKVFHLLDPFLWRCLENFFLKDTPFQAHVISDIGK